MDAKQKLQEATERYRAAIRHCDAAGMDAALTELDAAHKRYVASLYFGLLSKAVRAYAEAQP